MTELEFIAKVSYLLEKKAQGRLVPPEAIQASLPLALGALGREIAASGEYSLQQKEFEVTLTSGVASLSSITDMIVETIDTVKHPDVYGEARYFSRIPDGTEADLASVINTMYPPYIVEHNKIKCSLGNGTWPASDDLPPDTSSLKVIASAAPTLSTVHGYFEDRLIELGAEYALKFPVPAQEDV
jgi:hypothetical protein